MARTRSSITGRFVKAITGRRWPRLTVRETDAPQPPAAQDAAGRTVDVRWPTIHAWTHGRTVAADVLLAELRDAAAYFAGE